MLVPALDTARTLEQLSTALGLVFEKSAELSNEYFSVYEADGHGGSVTSAELRIGNNDPTNRIIIFDINPALAITHSDIIERYPDATLEFNSDGAPERNYYEVKSNSGAKRYVFNADGYLVSIVYDTAQTK